MKILFFTENFPPETNASASRVFERACYWVKWGHQVTIITCAPNFPQGKVFAGYQNLWYQTEILSGIKVVRVKTYISANQGTFRRSLDFFSFLITGFFGGLFQPRPDVVVATSPQYLAAVAGWCLSLAKSRPFVFELGDLWPLSISAVGILKKGLIFTLFEKFELFLYRRSAKVVALTGAFKKNLVLRGISEDKIEVVLNGVELSMYGSKKKSLELVSKWNLTGKFVVGYIGTHGMAHGLINVIEAAEKISKVNDIVFMFVGDGAEREQLIQEAALRKLENILFISQKPKQMIPEIWSLCDVALVHLKDSPVFSEVIPSKIFEAMAMALPVLLVSPEGEGSNLLKKYSNGIWIKSGQPTRLAESVISLKNNRNLLRKFSDASSNSVGIWFINGTKIQTVNGVSKLDIIKHKPTKLSSKLRCFNNEYNGTIVVISGNAIVSSKNQRIIFLYFISNLQNP